MAPYANDFLAGNEKNVFTEFISFWKDQPAGNIAPLNETNDKKDHYFIHYPTVICFNF